MAWPSFMPLAARPSNWIDWSATFRDVIPREWPKRLFGAGSQALSDLIAFGESLAIVRDYLSFLQNSLYPNQDTNGIFTEDWERVFGVQASGTIAERNDRLVAMFRTRGTMTQDAVKTVMCRAFGIDDPTAIGIISPTPAAVAVLNPPEVWQWVFPQTNMHIFHLAETIEPDWDIAQDLIDKIKPTWETWSFGKRMQLKWGVHADDGEWDRRVWG
ncbi:MAG: hypothetical protein V3W44_10745 [Dehalococcoidales bacterium]